MAELTSIAWTDHGSLAHHNRDQDALAIGDLYRRAGSAMVDSVRYQIEAGHRLNAKKATLRHGEWLPWLAENADVLGFETRSTAARLMKVAEQCRVDATFDTATALQISRMTWGNVDSDGLRGTRGTGDNEWFTPVDPFINAARTVLGTINLDPATHTLAQQTVQAETYFTREDNGLAQEWHGTVWLNPPYARDLIGAFVDKLISEIDCGNTTAAIMLTHNYTDTDWFHRAAAKATLLCFTRGRVRFLNETGEECNPTQGQAFFYYGPQPELFRNVFSKFGFIFSPNVLDLEIIKKHPKSHTATLVGAITSDEAKAYAKALQDAMVAKWGWEEGYEPDAEPTGAVGRMIVAQEVAIGRLKEELNRRQWQHEAEIRKLKVRQ